MSKTMGTRHCVGCVILFFAFIVEAVILWGAYSLAASLLGISELNFLWFILAVFVLNFLGGLLVKSPAYFRKRAGRKI